MKLEIKTKEKMFENEKILMKIDENKNLYGKKFEKFAEKELNE